VNLTWIPELGRWLGGPLLVAWQTDARIRARWAANPPACMGDGRGQTVQPPASLRHGRRCKFLGDRLQQTHGCNGWGCLHECGKLDAEVTPAAECQTCDHFKDAGRF
jgi:hypothetical protein